MVVPSRGPGLPGREWSGEELAEGGCRVAGVRG